MALLSTPSHVTLPSLPCPAITITPTSQSLGPTTVLSLQPHSPSIPKKPCDLLLPPHSHSDNHSPRQLQPTTHLANPFLMPLLSFPHSFTSSLIPHVSHFTIRCHPLSPFSPCPKIRSPSPFYKPCRPQTHSLALLIPSKPSHTHTFPILILLSSYSHIGTHARKTEKVLIPALKHASPSQSTWPRTHRNDKGGGECENDPP